MVPRNGRMSRHDPGQSEWLTRKSLIDPRLQGSGWAVVPFDPIASPIQNGCYAITEYPTATGPADYALAADGTVFSIVEAKKLTLGPQGVLTQAARYARGLPPGPFDFDGLRVPFLYSTNGEVILFHDVRHPLNRSRKVGTFHSPAALHLNHRDVIDRRKALCVDIRRRVQETDRYLWRYDAGDGTARQAFDDAIRDLRGRLAADAPCSATARAMLMGLRGTHPFVNIVLAG